jgi:hypothetical protein
MNLEQRDAGRIRLNEMQARDLLEYLRDAQDRLLAERRAATSDKFVKADQLKRLRRTLDELQRMMGEMGWMDPDDPWYGHLVGGDESSA